MLSSTFYEQSKSATRAISGGNLSQRYDRICPVVRRGQKCKQHETFKSWCNAKERNLPSQQLLAQSAAVVFMTYREDTIQKQDCPFLHPKPGEKPKDATKAAISKNAMLIEGLVDYFYAEQEKTQQTESSENTLQPNSSSSSSSAAITTGISIKLERDPTSAIMANQVVDKLFDTLTPDAKKLWRPQDLIFNNADFCTCFCSAVAIMIQINDNNPNASKIRSIFLQENKINSDAMENIVRAMKMCKVQRQTSPKNSSNEQNKDNNNNTNISESSSTAAATATTTLASQVILLDLSNNKIDNLTRCLFEFKAYFPSLLSLLIRENPITKRPDYSELVRRTVPQIVMLDGKSLRRPPLKMPYPRTGGGADFDIDTSSPANQQIAATQRGARNFIAAYLKSLENNASDIGATREELYKEDEDLRDQVMHPGIVASVSFVPTSTHLFNMPDDVLTEEECIARAKALEKKGGRVGALSREKAQNLVLEKKMSEKLGIDTNNNKRRQRNDEGDNNKEGEQKTDKEILKTSGMRFVTKLDAKIMRSLPVSATRNCRSISDGKNSLERIAKGRLEVMDLLFGSIYLEGLAVSHHTSSGSIATVTPMCMPSLWKLAKEQEKQRKIQQRSKELNVVGKSETNAKNKKDKKSKKGGGKGDDDGDNEAGAAVHEDDGDAFAVAKGKGKSPCIFLVTVHGTMSWRPPSLMGQSTICAAADHTFCVVATEDEDFFQDREAEDEKRFNEYMRKMSLTAEEEETEEAERKQLDEEEKVGDNDDDDDESLDDEFKSPQQLQKEEMLRYLDGFRICNHAVMLREVNGSSNNTTTSTSTTNNNSNNNGNSFFAAPFLFNPTRAGRLERLAHIYGTTAATVAKVMERCENDAACEEMLAKLVMES